MPTTFDEHTEALLNDLRKDMSVEQRKAIAEDRTTPAMREAFDLLLNRMTAEQRGYVVCWFCDVCREYVPPGESCKRHEHLNCDCDECVKREGDADAQDP
jgi:hypothetical protein